ncbi:MAG TPA: hypothetical protein VLA67_06755 [Nitrospiraceae bacterium]|nr:hypothetical protein [Nitrospiraceae bacterium]
MKGFITKNQKPKRKMEVPATVNFLDRAGDLVVRVLSYGLLLAIVLIALYFTWHR